MLDIIEQAKAEFYKIENCSCVILDENNKVILISHDNGIKPLISAIDVMKNAVIADKIIGKAAALICVYGGVKAVYGHIMSASAQEVFNKHSIEYAFSQTTEHIINRQGDDICPMEKLVIKIDSPKEAFDIILGKIGR